MTLTLIYSRFDVYKIIFRMDIVKKIKELRNAKGMSQKELAMTIGIDQAQYSRIESGKVEPTLSSLERIADALGIGIGEFFSERPTIDVNTYDKSILERLRLLEELGEEEKKPIFSIIDMAIAKNRMKSMLSDALKMA